MIGPISKIYSTGGLLHDEPCSLISNEELQNIITQLESDIENNSWYNKRYAQTDIEVMPALVKQANNKYPEMNLSFIESARDLYEKIISMIENSVEHSRLIINAGDGRIHFSVIDYKKINGKTSLILFEPASFNGDGPAILAFRVARTIERIPFPDCYFSMAEMDIQRSSSECGIFSLALAKKLYTERNELLKIHEDNINGTLTDSDIILPHNRLDLYLPVTFYKHAQSKRRINEYLNTNPQAVRTIVNKKNETIFERLDKNKSFINEKELSISVHKKRITEYKKILKP